MNTCKTCIHWRNVTNGAKSVRLDDVAIRCCTALPPQGDFRWPRSMEHHTCGMHDGRVTIVMGNQPEVKMPEAGGQAAETAQPPVQSQVSDLLHQVESPAAPAKATRSRRGGNA